MGKALQEGRNLEANLCRNVEIANDLLSRNMTALGWWYLIGCLTKIEYFLPWLSDKAPLFPRRQAASAARAIGQVESRDSCSGHLSSRVWHSTKLAAAGPLVAWIRLLLSAFHPPSTETCTAERRSVFCGHIYHFQSIHVTLVCLTRRLLQSSDLWATMAMIMQMRIARTTICFVEQKVESIESKAKRQILASQREVIIVEIALRAIFRREALDQIEQSKNGIYLCMTNQSDRSQVLLHMRRGEVLL